MQLARRLHVVVLSGEGACPWLGEEDKEGVSESLSFV
jgi:hypothetical protein